MFIIIAGAGKVGGALARDLCAAGHEVVVLEHDTRKAQSLADEIGSSVISQDASEGRWLIGAGIERADLLIAVTGDDEDNIIISQLGRALSDGRARTIARINNPRNNENFRLLGIESIVNATDLVMNTIERDVSVAPIVHLMRLQSAGMELVELPVIRDSPAHGATAGDLDLPARGGQISVILRNDQALFPRHDTVLEAGDLVVAVVRIDQEEELRRLFAPRAAESRREPPRAAEPTL